MRDCISNPGDYVLTCMADGGKVLHFKLNKAMVGNDAHYQFEGDLFPSVADLIMYHLRTSSPISDTSLAVILGSIHVHFYHPIGQAFSHVFPIFSTQSQM